MPPVPVSARTTSGTDAMYPKTIARLGLKLLGAFLLLHALCVLINYPGTPLIRQAIRWSFRLDALRGMNLSVTLATVLPMGAIGTYLLFGGRKLTGRIAADNRLRCLECDYQLAGLQADCCPECGSPIPGAASAPAADVGALTCRALLRVVTRVLGVGLIALCIPRFSLLGLDASLSFAQRILPFVLLSVSILILGVYLVVGGEWLVRRFSLAYRRVLSPSSRTGAAPASRGIETSPDLASGDPPSDAHPSSLAYAMLLCALMSVVALGVLIAKSDLILRSGLIILHERLGRYTFALGLLHYAAIASFWGLCIGAVGYLLVGGRWMARRLLDGGAAVDPASEREWGSSDRREFVRGVLMLLGVYLLVTSLPDVFLRVLYGLASWLRDGADPSFLILHALTRLVGSALGLYLFLGRPWLVDRVTGPQGTGISRASRNLGAPPPTDVAWSGWAWLASLLRVIGVYVCVIAVIDLSLRLPGSVRASLSYLFFDVGPIAADLVAFAIKFGIGAYILWRSETLLGIFMPASRRYCATCHYELPGRPEETCPECDEPLEPMAEPAGVS